MDINKKGAFVLWLTGLPCSGKTTIGQALYREIKRRGLLVRHLDGDVVRKEMNKDLGFSKKDRDKNLEIISSLAKKLNKQGVIVVASFVSPYKDQRERIRKKIENFIEIYINAPLDVCEKRDVKGLYKRARLGKIKNLTGISDPYEAPEHPQLELKTDQESVRVNTNQVIAYLIKKGYL